MLVFYHNKMNVITYIETFYVGSGQQPHRIGGLNHNIWSSIISLLSYAMVLTAIETNNELPNPSMGGVSFSPPFVRGHQKEENISRSQSFRRESAPPPAPSSPKAPSRSHRTSPACRPPAARHPIPAGTCSRPGSIVCPTSR